MSVTSQAVPSAPPLAWSISFRVLLALYLIIPACVLLQWCDVGVWAGYLKTHLPSSPNHFLLFQILFGTPHIIASAIILVSNAEYRQQYRRHVGGLTLVLLVVFGLGSLFIPYRVFYVFVAAWTVFHVLKQQHGLARGVCKLPTWAFYLLLGLSVMTGLVVYIGIFLKNSLGVQETEWLRHVAGSGCVALFCTGLLCQRLLNTALGKWFLWANILLVISSFYFYVQDYYFFAILVPRLVHDVTAYIFYVTHDHNKHALQPKNTLYHWANALHLPIILVLPVLSFALAFVLKAYGDTLVTLAMRYLFDVQLNKAVTLGGLGYLALLHYYSEALTWRQGSPYRQFIAFTK